VALLIICPAALAQSITPKAVKTALKQAAECKHVQISHCAATRSLVKMGAAAAPTLRQALTSKSAKRVAAALAALTMLRDKSSGDRALKLLQHKDASVRHAAIIAVGILQPPAALRVLARLLGRTKKSEKAAVCAALGLTRSPAAVKPLKIARSSPSIPVKVAAIRALGQIQHQNAVADITETMKDAKVSSRVELAIIRALADSGKKEATPYLIAYAKRQDDKLARAAARALGRLKDPRGGPVLATLLKRTTMLYDVIIAVGMVGEIKAIPALLRIITERQQPERILNKAFWAIGRTKAKAAVRTLTRFLKDKDTKYITWAAAALGAIRSRSGAEALFKALKIQQDATVRAMIIWALEKISQKRFGDDIKRWEMWVYAPDRLN
jgi:HEAT repeat protein